MKKILLALSVAFTISSCGIYSKYEGTTTVDDKLYGQQVKEATKMVGADTTHMMGNISWRDMFPDSKLQMLIDQALESNTNLRTAVLNVESAQIALKSSRLAFLPSLSIGAQGEISGLVDGGSASKTYSVPLTASWEVDLFGRLRNDKLRSKMVAEQSEFVEQAVRVQVVSSTAKLYYTLSMLDSQIEISKMTIKSVGESVKTARALKEAGLMNEAGLSQLEANLYSVKSSLAALLQARKQSENAMCSILATSPKQISVESLKSVALPKEMSLGVPMQILSARPDVMAAESALAASFYSENMARSSMYPSLTLMGTAGWTNSLGGVVVNPAEAIYSAVGSLVQPIFNRGLNRAQLEIAKRTFEQSKLAFEQTLLDSGIEVNSALAELFYTKQQAINYNKQVAALEKAEKSTQLLMQYGNTTYLEVLTAQQTLYSAQLQRVNNMYDQFSSLISLYSALGGGRF